MEMTSGIWLIPALPLSGFLVISLLSGMLNRKAVGIIGVSSVTLSAIITIIEGIHLLSMPGDKVIVSNIYTWMNTGGFTADISFLFDPLSLVFCFVITFVGALIHLYSVEYMHDEEGYARYFSYMNLFVGSMLILVLAGNLLLLYLGWEGVGLCSYLLIGFWYKIPENGYAARKAFIVTRVGDTAMIIGLFVLIVNFGTLDIQELMQRSLGSPVIAISAILLLGGAIGKSAQIPLHTWLPDAMAGPSPVSALIHAATMVTAGVYLVTRTNALFIQSPVIMSIVAIIGAITLLVAGFSALAQTDLKRVLAYSTISQIGYMFFAMGIGAWSAGIFHFMIHAFFKALLFLAAGVVIHVLHHEQNMFRMGGLYKKLPVVFFTFLIGGASLSALPLVTAGFFSKDQILWLGWASQYSNQWLWVAGITGSLLTSLYTFRMIFLTFFGEAKTEPAFKPGRLMTIPLVILAFLSVVAGFIEMPENMGSIHLISRLFNNILPPVSLNKPENTEVFFQIISAVISLGGVFLAYLFFYRKVAPELKLNPGTIEYFRKGWGFDRLYDTLFVRPFAWLSEIDRRDFVDRVYTGIAKATIYMNSLLGRTQNGSLRLYVLVLTAGLVIILTLMISL